MTSDHDGAVPVLGDAAPAAPCPPALAAVDEHRPLPEGRASAARPRVLSIRPPIASDLGPTFGQPAVIVRFGGCDFRCRWCNAVDAVDPDPFADRWRPMSTESLAAEIKRVANYAPMLVILTGGNPAIQPLGDLIDHLGRQGYSFAIETQGTVIPHWAHLAALRHIVVSPKPPSSGMSFSRARFEAWMGTAADRLAVNLIVNTDFPTDVAFAANLRDLVRGRAPIFLHPCDPALVLDDPAFLLRRYRELVALAVRLEWHDARILPPLHALAWGPNRRS